MARQTAQQVRDNAAAAVHAEQQAELKRLRAEKAAATRRSNKAALDAMTVQVSAAEHAKAAQPEASAADIEDLMADLNLPSGKRVLVGLVLALGSAFSVGYGIGMLLSYAIAGILVLTSTAWIAFTLTVLAWIIAIYASWKIGGYVGGKVFASVVLPDGLASRSWAAVAGGTKSATTSLGDGVASARNKVGGWFTTAPVQAA